jgi:hypothetical protein
MLQSLVETETKEPESETMILDLLFGRNASFVAKEG